MKWRVLDTGPRSAADNMALDRAMLDARSRGEVPNTLRFLQFSPAAVLVGHHQAVSQEVRIDYCERHGVDINRRLTGGGAIYFDPTQIGWEIIADRRDFGRLRMDQLTALICEAAAAGLRTLGVKAEFRPRNDIEVEGKKISGTGGTFEGDIFLFQGTVLTDFDIEAMLLALKVPTEKLTPKGLETARDRVTCLRDLLEETPSAEMVRQALIDSFARAFDAELVPGELTPAELEIYEEVREEFGDDEWVHAVEAPPDGRQLYRAIHKRPGGLLRVHATVDVDRSILRQILITGDFFLSPSRFVFDLEAHLRDSPFPQVKAKLSSFFERHRPELVGLTPDDFWQAIRLTLEKTRYSEMGISQRDASAVYPINIPSDKTVRDVLCDATVLLLPYCAKLPDCEFRFRQGCDECGMCTIGDAYRLARNKGLEAVTIVKFEHLEDTLARMKQQGVRSYIGCACEAFVVKRHEAFRSAGLPGVILDIAGKTCYQLGQEGQAYEGTFEAMADLHVPLLEAAVGQVRGPRVGPTPGRDE